MAKAQTAGGIIRNARKAKRWTQPELAERVKSSPTTISNWETDTTKPGLEDIDLICHALEIHPEPLLEALGVTLTPPAVTRLPRPLVTALLRLSLTDQRTIARTARALAALPAEEEERSQ